MVQTETRRAYAREALVTLKGRIQALIAEAEDLERQADQASDPDQADLLSDRGLARLAEARRLVRQMDRHIRQLG